MGRLFVAVSMVAAFGFAAPGASAAPILVEAAFNQDGVVHTPGTAPGNWNLVGFDTITGLGTMTAQITGAGPHNILVFLDITIDGELDNEWGGAHGVLVAGLTWEIDEPGSGDIYANFAAGALDGNSEVPFHSPGDVSFALGRAFELAAGETATLNFRTSSLSGPDFEFYVVQVDLYNDSTVFFWSDVTIHEDEVPPVPEPSMSTLLGLGLAVAARRLRRRG